MDPSIRKRLSSRSSHLGACRKYAGCDLELRLRIGMTDFYCSVMLLAFHEPSRKRSGGYGGPLNRVNKQTNLQGSKFVAQLNVRCRKYKRRCKVTTRRFRGFEWTRLKSGKQKKPWSRLSVCAHPSLWVCCKKFFESEPKFNAVPERIILLVGRDVILFLS